MLSNGATTRFPTRGVKKGGKKEKEDDGKKREKEDEGTSYARKVGEAEARREGRGRKHVSEGLRGGLQGTREKGKK